MSMKYPLAIAQVDAPERGIQLLNTLTIVPSVQNASLETLERHWQIADLAERFNLPVQLLGYARPFSETRVAPFRNNTDLAVMPLKNDPMWQGRKKYPIPSKVRKDLRFIVDIGIDFDLLYIAHELPAGRLRSGDVIPHELIMPPPTSQQAKRLRFINAIPNFGLEAGQMAARGIAGVVGFALAVASLDPILFGGVVDSQSGIAAWYYLTHWTWDEE